VAKHTGIVAVSPEGSALCYRRIAKRAADIPKPERRPLVTVHNLPFSTYLECFRSGDWEQVGRMLRWSSETLAAAGADFCILPDNLAHHAFSLAETNSPLPWLNMIELVAQTVCDHQHHTVGLLGTKLITQSSTYQTILGLRGVRVLAPSEDDADALDRIIFDELVHGRVEAASRKRVQAIIDRLAEVGCEGVILGSTETPLLVTPDVSPLPTYDPVVLLADAAYAVALDERPLQ